MSINEHAYCNINNNQTIENNKNEKFDSIISNNSKVNKSKNNFTKLKGYNNYSDYFTSNDNLFIQNMSSYPNLISISEEEFTFQWFIDNMKQHDYFQKPIQIHMNTSNNNMDIGSLKHIFLPVSNDIYSCFEYITSIIGEDFNVKVINVATQQNEIWRLGEYMKYFNSSKHLESNKKIYNLISLEISLTPLGDRILGPKAIRTLDWIDQIWPIERRSMGDYPQVQKYCLVSMKGSYTDFHIDFGGTSVWYSIQYGKKIFFMIPPTIKNLSIYEEWLGNKNQHTIFLGELVDCCYKFELHAGEKLMIPSGWIHAVYTPEDSLVFGGNFLHSYSIIKQLQIHTIENRCNVEEEYKFPKFRCICAYVLFYLLPNLLKFIHPDLFLIKKSIYQYLKSNNKYDYHMNIFTNSKLFYQLICLLKIVSLWFQSSSSSSSMIINNSNENEMFLFIKEVNINYQSLDNFFNIYWKLLFQFTKYLSSNELQDRFKQLICYIRYTNTINIFEDEDMLFNKISISLIQEQLNDKIQWILTKEQIILKEVKQEMKRNKRKPMKVIIDDDLIDHEEVISYDNMKSKRKRHVNEDEEDDEFLLREEESDEEMSMSMPKKGVIERDGMQLEKNKKTLSNNNTNSNSNSNSYSNRYSNSNTRPKILTNRQKIMKLLK